MSLEVNTTFNTNNIKFKYIVRNSFLTLFQNANILFKVRVQVSVVGLSLGAVATH